MGGGPGGPARNPGTGCFVNRYRHVTSRYESPDLWGVVTQNLPGSFRGTGQPAARRPSGPHPAPAGTTDLSWDVRGPAGARSSWQGLLVIRSGSASLSSYRHAEWKDTGYQTPQIRR